MAREPTIPELPEGIVAVLATVGPGGPARDTGERAGAGRARAAAVRARGAPAAARPGCDVTHARAVALNGPGMSLCVEGAARIAADPLPGAEFMVAFRLEGGADPRRARAGDRGGRGDPLALDDREAAERHAAVMAALAALRARPG